MTAPRHRQTGWSLVELAVSLVIAALLTALLFTLLPLGRQVASGDRQQRQLAQAEEALLGYGLSHYHLPFADADGDGKADDGAAAGWLPVRTLEMSPRLRIRYEVDAALATAASRLYAPYLPSAELSRLSATPNGLDLCIRLFERQRAPVALGVLDMPAAYALAAPAEAGNALANTATNITSAAIHLPGSNAAANQPALGVAAGPGELASRMACPQLLARAHGAAQAAMAAYSIREVADFNRDFREFDIRIAQLVKAQSEAGLAFAGVGLAMGLFDQAMGVVLAAAGWPPEGFAIAVGIAENIASLTSIGYAIASVVLAKNDLAQAEVTLTAAEDALKRVEKDKARTDQLYTESTQAALRLEAGGTRR